MNHIQVYCLDSLLSAVAPTVSGFLGRKFIYLTDSELADLVKAFGKKRVITNLNIGLLSGAMDDRPFDLLSISQEASCEPFGIKGSAFDYGINAVLLKAISAELETVMAEAQLDDEEAPKELACLQTIFGKANLKLTPKAISRFLQLNTIGKLDSVRTHAFGHVYTVSPLSTLDMTSKLQIVKLHDKIPMGPDKVDLDFMNAVLVASKEAFQAMISGQLQRRKWAAKSSIPLTYFFSFLENTHRMVLSQEAREKCMAITRTGIVVEVSGNKYYVTLVDEGKELVIQAKRA